MAEILLADLDFPASLLEIFERKHDLIALKLLLYFYLHSECDIGFFELLTISVTELQEHLDTTGVNWCYDNLFSRIDSWRKRNVSQFKTVAEIEG